MERLEKIADVPKKQEWHRKNICKTCYWLRDIYRPSNGWDGKCCAYTYETECFVRFQLPRTIVRITSKRKGIGIGMVGKSLNKPKSLESWVMNYADKPLSPM